MPLQRDRETIRQKKKPIQTIECQEMHNEKQMQN